MFSHLAQNIFSFSAIGYFTHVCSICTISFSLVAWFVLLKFCILFVLHAVPDRQSHSEIEWHSTGFCVSFRSLVPQTLHWSLATVDFEHMNFQSPKVKVLQVSVLGLSFFLLTLSFWVISLSPMILNATYMLTTATFIFLTTDLFPKL